jgi:hypothetical protein
MQRFSDINGQENSSKDEKLDSMDVFEMSAFHRDFIASTETFTTIATKVYCVNFVGSYSTSSSTSYIILFSEQQSSELKTLNQLTIDDLFI